jgi:predicted ATPase
MILPLTAIAVEGYRSVRRIHMPVGHLTVLVGRNGVGKTNLYRALELLAGAARGALTSDIAEEGGIESVLWAGSRRRGKPVRLRLGVEFGDLEYAVEIGLPNPTEAAVSPTEPMIKAETLTHRGGRTASLLMRRQGPSVWLRDEEGRRQSYEGALLASETALASFQDAARYIELDLVRRALLDWRFYHAFRTDRASPVRAPALAVTAPTLASDGANIAACLATVMNVRGEAPAIEAALRDAFPDARLDVVVENGRVCLALELGDMPRPLAAHELSDGTLAYLCLVAALLSYRLPGFVALNEPESSLHADLIRPLARLIAAAAERSQIWVVTHSAALADAIEAEAGILPRPVVKDENGTWIEGLKMTGAFREDD